ncbi:MAG: hypothetical protein ACFBSC_12535 [Microcoleaceae cyanobacterium]
MNALWFRLLNSAYRREPIVSFILTIGAVNAVIGGLDASWSLFSFGLGTVGVAVIIRLWQTQRPGLEKPEAATEYYLPPGGSRPQLPHLSSRRQPPQS